MLLEFCVFVLFIIVVSIIIVPYYVLVLFVWFIGGIGRTGLGFGFGDVLFVLFGGNMNDVLLSVLFESVGKGIIGMIGVVVELLLLLLVPVLFVLSPVLLF